MVASTQLPSLRLKLYHTIDNLSNYNNDNIINLRGPPDAGRQVLIPSCVAVLAARTLYLGRVSQVTLQMPTKFRTRDS
jgi:hypothetical protein